MLQTLRQAAVQWQNDKASYLGAAIAYYALFSVGPLLVIAIAVAGMVYGHRDAEGRLVEVLGGYVGADSAQALQDLVQQSSKTSSGWAALIGGGVLLFTALGLFQQIKLGLHIIWKLDLDPNEGLVAGTVRSYVLALATLLVAVIFAVVVVVGSTMGTLLLQVWGGQVFESLWLAWLAYLAGTLLVLTLLFVFLFRLFSDGRIAYRHLWGGGFVTAVLFVLGKWLFGLYLASTSVLSAYGAASSLVVFLVWVYYSAQLVFFGAEVVQVSRQPGA